MKHLGDITKIHGYDMPIVDVITGGSPCQDLSVAGARLGLAGERSGLFMEQIRIIKEMREYDARTNHHDGIFIRPRFMVWENVPGAFSSNDGEDFRRVLEEVARVVDPTADIPRPTGGCWSAAGVIVGRGFSIAWRLHDAQFWGVPQRRKRIALVADFGSEAVAEILFERKSMSRNTRPGKPQGEDSPDQARRSVDETGGALSFLERAGKDGGAKAYSYNENEPPHSQPSTIKASCDNATAFVAGGHYRYKEDNKVGTLMTGTSVRGDTTLIYGKSDFGTYKEDSGTLRASGGDYGGGF